MTAAGFATVGRPEDLLLLAAGATLLALGGMIVAMRKLRAEVKPSASAAVRKPAVKSAQPAVNASSYTLLIAVCCVYTVLGREFVQQLFRSAAAAYSADGGSLAGGCGIIDAANGALQIVCMAAISGRVLKRFGPRPGMLAVPISLGLSVAGMAATCCWLGQPVAIFWMASVARLSENVSRFSFQQSALQCLCGAMAESVRTRLMAIIETIVKPLSSLLAGGLLLLLHGYCGYEISATLATTFVVAVAGSYTAMRLCRTDKRTVLPTE